MLKSVDPFDIQGGAAAPIGGEAASLSLNHNSAPAHETGAAAGTPDLPFRLTGSQLKTAHAIEQNVDRMVAEAGIERVGFLTLTVGDWNGDHFEQVRDAADASRRINNLARRFLPELFNRWVIVTERHKSGAIHFHLIVETKVDIRQSFDWDAVRAGDYSSACPALRQIWAMLRSELPSKGFGRSQLEPLKNGEACARYVAKYVEKNLFSRIKEDHRKKLVRYGGDWNGWHLKPNDFSWATPGACRWRTRAQDLAARADVFCRSDARKFFGPKWAYRFSAIMGAPEHQQGSWLEIAMARHVAEVTAEQLGRRMTEEESEECEMLEAWHGGVTWMDLKKEAA